MWKDYLTSLGDLRCRTLTRVNEVHLNNISQNGSQNEISQKEIIDVKNIYILLEYIFKATVS